MSKREEELAVIDKEHEKALAKLAKELAPDLTAVLSPSDGIARILAISDEEWQAALDADG